MSVLVTGSSGFVGSHLVGALHATDQTVIGVDRVAPRPGAPWPDVFYAADLIDPQALESVMPGVTAVYDLACDLGGVGYLEGGHQSQMWANNARCNLFTLEAAARHGARYLFTSSDCVYPADGRKRWTEDDAYRGVPSEAGYGAQKLAHEAACVAYRDRGIATRIARLHNMLGPYCDWRGGREKVGAALCRKVAEAIRDGHDRIAVWGDGSQVRALCWVGDVVRGLLLLMESDCPDPVNFGGPWTLTVDELAYTIMAHANVELYLDHVPGPIGAPVRVPDCRRARERLGWRPVVSVNEAVGKLFDWVNDQVAADSGVPA